MKSSGIASVLALAGTSLGAVASPSGGNIFNKRQNGGAFGLDSLQSLLKSSMATKPAKTVELKSNMQRAGAKRMQVYFGPYALPKKGEKSPMDFVQFDPASKTWGHIVDFPSDITLLSTDQHLEFEDGTRANSSHGIYSHHTFYMDISKTWKSAWTCPGQYGSMYPQIVTPVINAQDEEVSKSMYTSPDGKVDSGLYVAKTDLILGAGEVINYNNEEKKVFLVTDIEYLPGRQPGFLDSSIQALFVSGCDWNNIGGALSLKIPAGKKQHTFKSEQMMFADDGVVLNLLGHLHDGGTEITMKIKNQTVCASKALYGRASGHGHVMARSVDADIKGAENEGIISMSLCDTPIKVSKGDTYTIEASFDFEKHPIREQVGGLGEVMGMFRAVFARKI